MSSVDPFYTRQFRRADEDVVQRFREHEADDAIDGNSDYGDDFGFFAGLAFTLAVTAGAVGLIALIAAFWPH